MNLENWLSYSFLKTVSFLITLLFCHPTIYEKCANDTRACVPSILFLIFRIRRTGSKNLNVDNVFTIWTR